MADEILLRNVIAGDLPVLFEQQTDADAVRMAAFPSRDREAFMIHWAKLLADASLTLRTIVFEGQVAGYISSWQEDDQRLVAYWIGKNFWGRKIASHALAEFLTIVSTRPLFAHVAIHNIASIRVLEKCGFTISSDETKSSTASDGVEEVVMKLDR
ncbi:MAG TPA: GNAT family N-acetyltransferase [Gemmatales bacterium]|nr:GNAT family N-acetyltransferase [Gemmatales bacterium]